MRILGKLKKNVFEEVLVALTEFKNQRVIDIRVWFGSGAKRVATKKGITLSRSLFPEFVKLVLSVEKALEKEENTQ